jgi:hypothetical protein
MEGTYNVTIYSTMYSNALTAIGYLFNASMYYTTKLACYGQCWMLCCANIECVRCLGQRCAAAAAAAAADIIIIITDIVVNTTHPKLMMWYIGCIDRP